MQKSAKPSETYIEKIEREIAKFISLCRRKPVLATAIVFCLILYVLVTHKPAFFRQSLEAPFDGWRTPFYRSEERIRSFYEQMDAHGSSQSSSGRQLSALINVIQKQKMANVLKEPSDWSKLKVGSVVLFSGKLDCNGYGKDLDSVRNNSMTNPIPLALEGMLAGRRVKVPFSSNHLISPTVLTILFGKRDFPIRGLATVVSLGETNSPAELLPIEFGPGE